MKNIFKKSKLLAMIPLLLLLTGCDSQVYYHEASPFNFLTWGPWVDHSIYSFVLRVKENIISLIIAIVDFAQKATDMSKYLPKFLETMGDVGPMIRVINLLAIACMIVFAGKCIFDNYFKKADNQYAPTAIEMLKRIVVAAVIMYAMPYMLITSFSLSTTLGATTSNAIVNGDSTENNGEYQDFKNYFEEMRKNNIHFDTLCYEGQTYDKEDGVNHSDIRDSSFIDSLNKSHMSVKIIKTGGAYCNYQDIGGSINPTETNFIGVPRNVFETYLGSENYNKYVNVVKSGVGIVANIEMGFIFIIVFGISYNAMKAFYQRCVQLIWILLSSWFYVGSSIADTPNNSSISALLKKILSLCLTQFFWSIEMAMFIKLFVADTLFKLSHENLLTTIFVALAWKHVLMATPDAIGELVSTSSSAAAEAANSGKKALGFAKFLTPGA